MAQTTIKFWDTEWLSTNKWKLYESDHVAWDQNFKKNMKWESDGALEGWRQDLECSPSALMDKARWTRAAKMASR